MDPCCSNGRQLHRGPGWPRPPHVGWSPAHMVCRWWLWSRSSPPSLAACFPPPSWGLPPCLSLSSAPPQSARAAPADPTLPLQRITHTHLARSNTGSLMPRRLGLGVWVSRTSSQDGRERREEGAHGSCAVGLSGRGSCPEEVPTVFYAQ